MIHKWIEEQTFSNSDFSDQKLTHTEYESCTFLNCDFSKVDFTESELLNCQFEGCNFSLAIFNSTALKDIKFIGCKLIGLNFDQCSDFLFAVGFENCILDYSSFAEKKIKKTEFSNCSLKEVDFSGTDLSRSVFHQCDLSGTVFNYTRLEQADFRSAHNFAIDPELNTIKRAKFSLSGIPGLLGKYNIEIE